MSYIDESRGANERVLYRAHFPWFFAAGAWFLLVAAVIVGIMLYANDRTWMAGAVWLAGCAAFLAIMKPIWTTEIGVTTQRFVVKNGLIQRNTKELQLRSIEGVEVEQGVLGRLLGYGRIELHGTGVEEIHLPVLADPVELRKSIQDGIASAAREAQR